VDIAGVETAFDLAVDVDPETKGCVILMDQTVACWSYVLQATKLSGLSCVVRVVVTAAWACAVAKREREIGSLWCWLMFDYPTTGTSYVVNLTTLGFMTPQRMPEVPGDVIDVAGWEFVCVFCQSLPPAGVVRCTAGGIIKLGSWGRATPMALFRMLFLGRQQHPASSQWASQRDSLVCSLRKH
jgi:hypothetical protein